MAQKVTRWRPDTCGCTLEYAWDDAVPQDDRVHSFARAVEVCTDHATVPVPNLYNAVLGENRGKNRALEAISKAHPELTEMQYERLDLQIVNGEETLVPVNVTHVLRPDAVAWAFDDARKLVLDIPALKPAQRTALQALLVREVGPDAVRVR